MSDLRDVDSLLVFDVGSVSTRAILFDMVDGRYRYLAKGIAPTTAGSPYFNIGEGIHAAIEHLQKITGHVLMDQHAELILGGAGDGTGVDTCSAVISVGDPLKVVVAGLLEDVSLESARRLVQTTYADILYTISLNDHRKLEARLDAIMRLRPDLIVCAGGTEGGATQSVLKLIEAVGLASYLLPEKQRPYVLFVGNQSLKPKIESSIGSVTKLHFAPNIRPTLEVEQLEPAQAQLTRIYSQIRSQNMIGINDLNTWAKGGLTTSPTAMGRIIKFLSKAYKTSVIGVDVAASATTVAEAFNGNLELNVYPQFGVGKDLGRFLDHFPLTDITRWINLEISDEQVRDYLANKSIYPATLPATPEDLQIEQAIARSVMQKAVKSALLDFPSNTRSSREDLLPGFDLMFLTGSVVTNAPNPASCALMILDGLQPTGATTLVVDQHQILPALGAASSINPILVVQVQTIDANAFLQLGTVISPVATARLGMPILHLKITYEDGSQKSLEIRQGSLEILPLPRGQRAHLTLHPLHRTDVGVGPGRSHGFKVWGGVLGVLIDARGRPLVLPQDRSTRRELYKKWLWSLGEN